MKCVVGIDLERHYSSSIALLAKLKMPVEESILVHVTESTTLALPYSAYGMMVESTEILDSLHEAGNLALEEAKSNAAQFGLHPKTLLCDGFRQRLSWMRLTMRRQT